MSRYSFPRKSRDSEREEKNWEKKYSPISEACIESTSYVLRRVFDFTLLIFALSTAKTSRFWSGKCHFITSHGNPGIRRKEKGKTKEKYRAISEACIGASSYARRGFFRVPTRRGRCMYAEARVSVYRADAFLPEYEMKRRATRALYGLWPNRAEWNARRIPLSLHIFQRAGCRSPWPLAFWMEILQLARPPSSTDVQMSRRAAAVFPNWMTVHVARHWPPRLLSPPFPAFPNVQRLPRVVRSTWECWYHRISRELDLLFHPVFPPAVNYRRFFAYVAVNAVNPVVMCNFSTMIDNRRLVWWMGWILWYTDHHSIFY